MIEQLKHQILNRSFARRIGKTLSSSKQALIDNELPKRLYNEDLILNSNYKKIFIEIGFGMGEHFVYQVKNNPDFFYIGIEVYLNGVANVLKHLQNHQNFMILPDDIDLILNKIPLKTIDGIYVLFPDPWHKRRALKKRIFNESRLQSFKNILKNKAFIAFASDIQDYAESTYNLLNLDIDFSIKNKNLSSPHEGYIETKYHRKAIKEGRNAQFIQAYKNLSTK